MSSLLAAPPAAPAVNSPNFQRYYEEAGPDYAAWSPHFNMHFGFFRWGMNPLRREAMLEQMNKEILSRLHLNSEPSEHVPARILDLGCGLGATLRSFAQRLPWADLHGITLVPWQLSRAVNSTNPARKPSASRWLSPTTNTQHSPQPPSMLYTRSRAVAMPRARTNPRFFGNHTACCAPEDASLSPMGFSALVNCVAHRSTSTANSAIAGSSILSARWTSSHANFST